MGARDIEEQLEAAQADAITMEREIAKLRAVVARVADAARELREWEGGDEGFQVGTTRAGEQIALIVDGAADPKTDLSPLSTLTVNGKRLTWQEVAIDREERLRKLQPALTMLADLDRSRQGRHEGDVEGGAVSLGNPHLSTGQTIGYSIGGSFAYVVPEPRLRGDVEAWKVRRP